METMLQIIHMHSLSLKPVLICHLFLQMVSDLGDTQLYRTARLRGSAIVHAVFLGTEPGCIARPRPVKARMSRGYTWCY